MKENSSDTLDLQPNLRLVSVNPLTELLLDPNNPRYFSKEGDEINEAEFADSAIQNKARLRMDRYHPKELALSMKQNGFVPTDAIFVTKHDLSGKYLVKEGNRRVTALQNLLEEESQDKEYECPEKLREQIEKIDVLEVYAKEGDSKTVDEQIDYLLGVRHHGALKPHTPFARAQNAFGSYLKEAKQTDDTFKWDSEAADNVAKGLSVKTADLEKSFRVYRVMHQLDQDDTIPDGYIKGKYWSLMAEVFSKKKTSLNDFFPQDDSTFQVSEDSILKLDQLCHFSKKEREGAPVNKPEEWRPLRKILEDEDDEKKNTNLERILHDKEKPSGVWADRSAELKSLDWAKWLEKVTACLKRVKAEQFLQEPGSEQYDRAQTVLKKLEAVIVKLKKIQS